MVTVIVRRPHAYSFRRQHPKALIPGLVFLNPDGEVVGVVSLPSKNAVEELCKFMKRKQK